MSSLPWPASTARSICCAIAASAPSRSPCASAAASASRASFSASSSGNEGGKSPSIISLPFMFAYGAPIGPPSIASRNVCGSTSSASASAIASASPSVSAGGPPGARDPLRQPLRERQQPCVDDELEAAAGSGLAQPQRLGADGLEQR